MPSFQPHCFSRGSALVYFSVTGFGNNRHQNHAVNLLAAWFPVQGALQLSLAEIGEMSFSGDFRDGHLV